MPPIRKPRPDSRKTTKEYVKSNAVVSGQLDKKIQKQQQRNDNKRGIVFIKHLPHGFFEEQLKNYFEQFGAVTRLRLGRSRRTGGSKGYAFVEFEYPEVAEVAAETMDNYLMFNKVVKSTYIPPEKQLFNYFKTSVRKVTNKAGKELYVSHKTAAMQRKVKQMNNWSNKNYQKRALKKIEKVKKLNRKYAHLGIDFSKILVEPNNLNNGGTAEAAETNEGNPESTTGKNKLQRVNDEENNTKKSKKDLELQDLLGNTINDDSGDEDYIAPTDIDEESDDEDENRQEAFSDASSTSSNEETYGFSKDSEDEDVSKQTHLRKKSKNASISLGKCVRAPKVDGLEQLIKRKPHTGGVKKVKTNKPNIIKISKSNLQMAASKGVLKTLRAEKSKSLGLKVKPAKIQKNKK